MDPSLPAKTLPLFFPEVDPPRLNYTQAVSSRFLQLYSYIAHLYCHSRRVQDHVRAFRSQPLDYIKNYLIPKPRDVAILLPPRLNVGWIVDQDCMFEYAREHGTECLIEDHEGVHRNYYDACNEALTIMLEELNIPDDPRIEIVFACNGDYDLNPTDPNHCNFQFVLSVGSNYRGAILKEYGDKLRDFVAPGVEARWFLDSERWMWTRSRRGPQCKGTLYWSFFQFFNSDLRLLYVINFRS